MPKKSLPEVFAKTPFGMFFSGVEGKTHFEVAKSAGVDQMLMSYFHIQKKGNKLLSERFSDGKIKLLIDSGAHTFLNDAKYNDVDMKFWEEYIESYLKWAEEHKDIVFAIVELDIDDIVGVKEVERFRKQYFQPFEERTGIPVCYVWHDVKGLKEWTKMCKTYHYIGFSGQADPKLMTEKFMMKLIAEARRHGAVVHGFAMTKPSLLPKLPFFSVDSISWKMGEMFGVTYFWDGKKFHTIGKDQKMKRRVFKTRLMKMGLNWDKINADDNNEITKMNALAFLEVMRYIRKRLRTKQYWLKESVSESQPRGKVINLSLRRQNVSSAPFPDLDEWKDRDDIDEVSKALNISPDYSHDKVIKENVVGDMTILLNPEKYAEKMEEYTEEVLAEITEQYLEEVVEDKEEALQRLRAFFVEVVEGRNDFFYTHTKEYEGDEDAEDVEIAPRPKEREDYIDEETDLEEYAAEPLPEVDAYDNELMVVDDKLPAPRSADGKFVKGHNIRKPKNLYSQKYPKLACDTCYAAQACPEMRPGYVCAFNKLMQRFDSRDRRDVLEQMASIVNMNAQRLQRVAIFEMLDGGMPDGTLTALMQQQMQWLANMKQLLSVPTDGSVNPTGIASVNISGNESIIARIFGTPTPPTEIKTVKDEYDIIDAEIDEISKQPDPNVVPIKKNRRKEKKDDD